MSSFVSSILASSLAQYWQPLREAGLVPRPELKAEWDKVLIGSEYVQAQCLREPSLFAWLEEQATVSVIQPQALEQELKEWLRFAHSPLAMQPWVRKFRHRYLCRIIWRDLSGRAKLSETLSELSLLADTLLRVCQEHLFTLFCQQYGTPLSATGAPQPLTVFAMGKLGAQELNLSSDIDLIFAYEQEGELKGIAYEQFYLRLGQALIQVLDAPTVDGFAYRVDMRLRPWGNAGALVATFDSLARYYEQQAREWERYALIKIRPVAGDIVAGTRFVERLKPFVFRRYLDYGAFKSLREMKRLIEREVRQQGLFDDIKLGAGGIRDIEFIVQVHQLVHGGQQELLQTPHLLSALKGLAQQQLMAPQQAQWLRQAYVFLRRMEHRLQAFRDEQTQKLPADEMAQYRLAFTMGFDSVAACEMALHNHRARVRYQFQALISQRENENHFTASVDQQSVALWRGQLPKQRALRLLQALGLEKEEQVIQQLAEFRQHVTEHWEACADTLDLILPRLLEALGYQQEARHTLAPLLALLEHIVAYEPHHLELLAENPNVVRQLVKLSSQSTLILSHIRAYPALLEELLHVSSLYAYPSVETLQDELRQQLLRVPAEDMARQLRVVHHFKQVHMLRVMVQEATEKLSLVKASQYLTHLATVVVEQLLSMAWQQEMQTPEAPRDAQGNPLPMACLLVAYGKFGSYEMSYTSDVDLVLLYEVDETLGVSHEELAPWYQKVCRRFVQMFSQPGFAEPLYEVDMRLRPEGESGALAQRLSAFHHYQEHKAWPWEHQALVRARAVAGTSTLKQRFEAIRVSILRQKRHKEELTQAVLTMRESLHKQHSLASQDPLPEAIKFRSGGILDVEFMVQYGVLRWAHLHGELTNHTQSLALLDAMAVKGLVPVQEAGLLREAFLAHRSAVHRGALGKAISALEATYIQQLCYEVNALWQRWFASGLECERPELNNRS